MVLQVFITCHYVILGCRGSVTWLRAFDRCSSNPVLLLRSASLAAIYSSSRSTALLALKQGMYLRVRVWDHGLLLEVPGDSWC